MHVQKCSLADTDQFLANGNGVNLIGLLEAAAVDGVKALVPSCLLWTASKNSCSSIAVRRSHSCCGITFPHWCALVGGGCEPSLGKKMDDGVDVGG